MFVIGRSCDELWGGEVTFTRKGSWHFPAIFHCYSHDSQYFSLPFSFILINSGNEKMRMKRKKKLRKIMGIMRMTEKTPTVNDPNLRLARNLQTTPARVANVASPRRHWNECVTNIDMEDLLSDSSSRRDMNMSLKLNSKRAIWFREHRHV